MMKLYAEILKLFESLTSAQKTIVHVRVRFKHASDVLKNISPGGYF